MSLPTHVGESAAERGGPKGRVATREAVAMRQYLTFTLGSEVFAIPIQCIREIIEFGGLTPVPLMPAFLRGVINLRGAVVPVIDLSARFARETTQIGRRTCIVILEVEQEDSMVALGIVVDAVNEVLDVPENAIEPRPNFGAKIRADFISGIFSHADRFVIVLDIPQVLSVDELAGLAELASNDSDANSGPTN